MRRFLLTASALAAITVPSAAWAQYYADPYGAPGAVVVNPPAVVVNPPGVVAAPMVESQVYLAPGQTYVAPGTEYQDQPVIINGQRYYRDCWWDWGRRKCELKPWW